MYLQRVIRVDLLLSSAVPDEVNERQVCVGEKCRFWRGGKERECVRIVTSHVSGAKTASESRIWQSERNYLLVSKAVFSF